jgi:hypothetical protein
MTPDNPPSNTSGQGKDALVPPEIRRWNWGAAIFSSIWALANGLTSDKDTFAAILRNEGYQLGGAFFYQSLGSRGSELAWKYKQWPSVAAFQRVQTIWSVAGLALLISLAALLIVGFFLVLEGK